MRQLCKYKHKSLIIVDQAESPLYDLQQELKQNNHHNFTPIVADIRDKNRMNNLFSEYKPNLVFHAAAYKHVPLMEANPTEAIICIVEFIRIGNWFAVCIRQIRPLI